MKCLCCGKEISDHAAPQERLTGWHSKCVRTFFSANTLPELDLSDNILEQLVTETTGKGYTIPGVQKKLSFLQNCRNSFAV